MHRLPNIYQDQKGAGGQVSTMIYSARPTDLTVGKANNSVRIYLLIIITYFFFSLSRLRGLSKRHSRQSREGAPNEIGDEELQQQPDEENTVQESHQRETEIN